MRKRITSLFMVLALCLTLLPTAALAEGDPAPAPEQTETVLAPEEQEATPAPEEAEDPVQEEEPAPEAETPTEEPAEAPQEEAPTAEFAVQTEESSPAVQAAAHSHPICGETCSHIVDGQASHENIEWKPLTTDDDGKLMADGVALTQTNVLTAGSYYLADDLELSTCIETPGYQAINLDLNGHTLTVNANTDAIKLSTGVSFTLSDCSKDQTGKVTHGENYTGRGVYAGTGSTFTMYGGSITGNNSSYYNGSGVFVAASSTFNMYGGSITGNTSAAYGGGVYLNTESTYTATFNMYGGSITNNAANSSNKSFGGGVYMSGGSFTMTGGSITGNQALYGGGVYAVSSASLTVCGAPKISGNTSNNVYLSLGNTITIGTDGLESDAKIGVTTGHENSIDSGKFVTVATGANNGYHSGNIFSDVGGACGTKAEGDNVNLYNGLPHQHPICGETCTHLDADGNPEHPSVEWTGVSALTDDMAAGYYYLLNDVVVEAVWAPANDVTLCLNGHSVTKSSSYAVRVNDGVTFTLCDAHDAGQTGVNGVDLNGGSSSKGTYSTFNMYGGRVTSTDISNGVQAKQAYCRFNLYGGTITGSAAGVYLNRYSSNTFNMYGGTITGSGVGVKIVSGTFTMYDGSITGNGNGDEQAGGVHLGGGQFRMLGGSITNNYHSKVNGAGGVYVNSKASFAMSGDALVSGNTLTVLNSSNANIPSGGGAGVNVYSGTLNLSGNAKITGNTVTTNSTGVGSGGVYLSDSSTLTVSGNASVSGNKTADGADRNVYLPSGKTVKVSSALTDGAAVGVTTAQELVNSSICVADGSDSYTLTDADLGAISSDAGYRKQLIGGSIVFAGGTAHEHAICGKAADACTDSHGDVLWLPVTFEDGKLLYGGIEAATSSAGFYYDADSDGDTEWVSYTVYTLPAGNYYLADSITIDGSINISGDVNFCLNGKTLETSKVTTGVFRYEIGKLTVCDCQDGGQIKSLVINGSLSSAVQFTANQNLPGTPEFDLYGGKITGAHLGVNSGIISSTDDVLFRMYGGEISGNVTGVHCSGKVEILGGTITGNTNGVNYFGELTVGGSPNITGNTKNNIYINGKTFTIDPSLTQDARMGISTATAPTDETPVQFATGASGALNYAGIFTPDVTDQGYVVAKTGTDLYLSLHRHAWTYTVSGDGKTISAACTAEGCPDTNGGTVTVTAPADLAYNGQPKAASVTGDSWTVGDTADITILYTGADGTVYAASETAPTNAGTYTASISVGDGAGKATASVKYTIAKVAPVIISWMPYTGPLPAYNGQQVSNPTEAQLPMRFGSFGDITGFKWYTATQANGAYTKGAELSAPPTDAGDYYIEAIFKEGENTTAAVLGTGLTIRPKSEEEAVSPAAPYIIYANRAYTYEIDLSGYLTHLDLGTNVTYTQTGGDLAAPCKAGSLTLTADGKLSVPVKAASLEPYPNTVATLVFWVKSSNYDRITLTVPIQMIAKESKDLAVSITGWTYGGSENAPQYTKPEGTLDDTVKVTYAVKNADGTNGAFAAAVPADAGSYTVKVELETDDSIYTGTADFAIAPKSIQDAAVTVDRSEQLYNGGEKKPAVLSVVLDGNTLTAETDYTVAYSNNINATTASSAQAAITITGTGNYTGEITKYFSINPAHLTLITQKLLTASATYGAKASDIAIDKGKSLVYYDGVSARVYVTGSWKFESDEVPTVGTTKEYTAIFTPDSNAENYARLVAYVVPVISPAAGSVTAPAGKTDLVYNGAEQELLGTLPTSTTGTVQYSLDGTTYTTDVPKGKDAKTYTVWYKVVGDNNHLDVAAQSLTVTIAKKSVAIPTANSTAFTYTGEAQTYTLAENDAYTISGNTQTAANEAGYTVTVALKDTANTKWSDGSTDDKTYSFVIEKKSITAPAEDTTAFTYNGQAQTYTLAENDAYTIYGNTQTDANEAGYTVTVVLKDTANTKWSDGTTDDKTYSFVIAKKSIAAPAEDTTAFTYNGQAQTYTLTEDDAYTISGNTQTDANEAGYTVTVALKDTANTKWADGSTDDKTYSFVIAKKSITAPAADATAFTYNGQAQTYTLAEDEAYIISGNVQTDANEAGYTVTVALKDTANTKWSDGTTDDKTYTFVIAKKSITAPTEDTTAFTYTGEAQTYTLAENDAYTISGNTQTNANEAGYTVTVALKDTANTKWSDGSTADKTYSFVIKKAIVTITVKDKRAYVGADAPDLSKAAADEDYTVSGLIGTDTLGGTITLAYGADLDMTKIGTATITASGATASENYTIQYVDGTLTIAKRSSSGGGAVTPTYPVNTPAKADNGSVSADVKNAAQGSTVTITVKPDSGYQLADLVVTDKNGNQVKLTDKGNGKYTFTMPSSAVEIKPIFAQEKETTSFGDVAEDAYYYEAVKWANDQNITGGTGNGRFSPDASCTRAQIVTFLWRAAGAPEPKGSSTFSDVPASSYYAKAVAWAVENGITTGTGDGTTFSPDATCTRAQGMTFLYRAAKAAATGAPAFLDVAADAWYAPAVKWATDNGITNGIGGSLFGSDNACTRAQIVTFLWRLYAGK